MLIVLFFAVLVAIGAVAAQDYAVSTDEPNMRELAEEAYEVVFRGGAWPESLARRYHGALVEFTIAVVEHASGLRGIALLTMLRHVITFLFFVLGVGAFAALCTRAFRDWRMGLLGAAFLIISPRIFAHAFINSRDVPHLALFTLAMAAVLRFLDRKTVGNAVLLGMAVAADIAVRSMGIVLVPLAFAGFAMDMLQEKPSMGTVRRGAAAIGVFVVVSGMLTIALWPLLWTNPIGNFLAAVRFASSFGGSGLYLGEQLTQMPWHYVFVWIGISVPPLYTALFLIGIPHCLCATENSWQLRNRILMLLWFFVPMIPVIVGSGIYNEWRHLFFVYPAFLFIALDGYHLLRRGSAYRRHAVTAAVMACLGWTGLWMWRNHPLQNLYFSIPTQYVQGNFDLDYWGLTSRKALEAITASDKRPKIALRVTNNITLINAKTFFPGQILYGTEADDRADYIIDTSSDQRYARILPPEDLLTVIGPDGLRAASIYVGPALKAQLEENAAF